MAEAAAANAAISVAKAAVVDLIPKLLQVVNDIRSAKWDIQQLPQDLDDMQAEARLVKASAEDAGLPTTRAGRLALQQLKEELERAEQQLGFLRDVAVTPGKHKLLRTATKNAVFPPEWKQQLPQLRKALQGAHQRAKNCGAFVSAITLLPSLPALHIPFGDNQHGDVKQWVVDKLTISGARGVLIYGSRGMGKTTLANDVCKSFLDDQLADSFPEGVFGLHFGPGSQPVDVQVATQQRLLLRMMQGKELADIKDADADAVAAKAGIQVQLGHFLRGKKCLLLLDDVRDAKIIHGFRFPGFQGALLVTGLSAAAWLDAPASIGIEHSTVTSGFAEQLLASRAFGTVSRHALPPELQAAGDGIITACAGSVLALVVMGCYLRNKRSAEQWQSALEGFTSIVQRQQAAGEYDHTVFGTLQLALEGLHPEQQAAFRALEVFAAGVAVPPELVRLAVEVVTGQQYPGHQLQSLMEGLVEAWLVQQTDDGGYQLLDLVQRFLASGQDRPSQQVFRAAPPQQQTPLWAVLGLFLSWLAAVAAMLGFARRAVPKHNPKRLLAAFLLALGTEEVAKQAEAWLGHPGAASPGLKVPSRLLQRLMSDSATNHDVSSVVGAILAVRGVVKRMLGRHAEALADLDRADELQPNDAFTLHWRGAVERMLGRPAEALSDLDRADELQPNNAFTLQQRGAVKSMLCRHAEALADLDCADALQPNDAFTLLVRGAVKSMLDMHAEALADLDRADQLQPNDASTLNMRGKAKLKLGRDAEAWVDLGRVNSCGPTTHSPLRSVVLSRGSLAVSRKPWLT